MQTISTIAVSLATVAALAGCHRSQSVNPAADVETAQHEGTSPSSHLPTDIDWFDGSVDAAFAKAQRDNRPVLLYWGAAWCPPCHELKEKVFSRPEFVEKTKLFVPVYLDGDDPGAQKWGETFGARGYPTVLVLRADRSEVVRLAGVTDLNRYAAVLDIALNQLQPIEAVVASINGSTGPLSLDVCRRIAYSSYLSSSQSGAATTEAVSPSDDARNLDLRRVAERCPPEARVERARLTMKHLTSTIMSLVRKEGEDTLTGKSPASPPLKEAVRELIRVQQDPKLARAVSDLTLLHEGTFDMAERMGAMEPTELRRAREHWARSLELEAEDPALTMTQRLEAFAFKLARAKKHDPAGRIPEPLAAEARSRVEAALGATHSTSERVGIVGAVLSILHLLGDTDRVRVVLEKEIATSATPYYYMTKMAQLEERLGHKETALEWFRRAYRASTGVATRFAWGVDYVQALTRLTPSDERAVRDAAIEVLAELHGPDRLHGETRGQLKALESNLRKWSSGGSHGHAVAAIRGSMARICEQVPSTESSSRKACAGFLAPKEA